MLGHKMENEDRGLLQIKSCSLKKPSLEGKTRKEGSPGTGIGAGVALLETGVGSNRNKPEQVVHVMG